MQSVQAASAPSCAAAWCASQVYTGGNTASENGINYVANWWTQGNDPATNSGGAGSGQPWASQGSCGAAPAPSPSPSPAPAPAPASGSLLFSPYKDVTVNLNWNINVMQTAVTGTAVPVVGSGSQNWGGIPAASFASANVQAPANAGLSYVVSTGGQAGTFICSTPTGMAQFLSTYNSSHLVGVDFDIEGGQTQAQISSLVTKVAYANTLSPNLRFSFTLAVSDGSYGGPSAASAWSPTVSAIWASRRSRRCRICSTCMVSRPVRSS